MATDQIAARGDASNLGFLINFFLRQGARLIGLLDGLGLADSIWKRAARALLEDDAVAIAGVQWKKVTPNSFLSLICDFSGKCGVGVNEL